MHFLQVAAVVLSLACLGPNACLAEQIEPLPAGYSGTKFRGLALGQNPEQVDQILTGLGLRCREAGQLNPPPPHADHIRLISTWQISVCRIDWREAKHPLDDLPSQERHMYDFIYGYPFYGVLFVEGRAAAITLHPEFFNADRMPLNDFARRIVDNYPIADGFSAIQDGWQGYTAKGERLVVRSYRSFAHLVVTLNSGGQGQSFN